MILLLMDNRDEGIGAPIKDLETESAADFMKIQ